MIRRVELQDAKAITTIYNEYVGHSVATFETEPLREEDMRNRIAGIAVRFPYFVYEEEGKVVGYCYAHLWKERAAYRHTLETTVYLAPGYEGKGIGRELMERLIEECRRDGYRALIACVTEGNVVSDALPVSYTHLSFDASKGEFRLFGVTADVGGHSYMNYLKVPAKVDELCMVIWSYKLCLLYTSSDSNAGSFAYYWYM